MKKYSKESNLLVAVNSDTNLITSKTYVDKFKPKGIVITMLCDRGEG